MSGWTDTDQTWNSLTSYQKAALMALMEADGRDPVAAKNALGAMVNRAAKTGEDIGRHVSQSIYQPTIESSQRARIPSLMQDPRFGELTAWGERRAKGLEPDPVGGATHFLAHEPVMERLRAQDPGKYRSWVNWTGYNRNGGQYENVTTRDPSHAFLALDGGYSVPSVWSTPQQTPSGVTTTTGPVGVAAQGVPDSDPPAGRVAQFAPPMGLGRPPEQNDTRPAVAQAPAVAESATMPSATLPLMRSATRPVGVMARQGAEGADDEERPDPSKPRKSVLGAAAKFGAPWSERNGVSGVTWRDGTWQGFGGR